MPPIHGIKVYTLAPLIIVLSLAWPARTGLCQIACRVSIYARADKADKEDKIVTALRCGLLEGSESLTLWR